MYATAGHEARVRNLAGISLATDDAFSDGSAREPATVTRSVAEGFAAALTPPG